MDAPECRLPLPRSATIDNKKYINRISKDITQKVMQAMETGFKKYIK
jgi:hypothetical protein